MIWRWHFYAGLFCIPFILILSITGPIYLFKPQIEAWIDKEKMLDLETADRKITMRFGEIERSVPLGIATYQTKAAFRNIRLRKL